MSRRVAQCGTESGYKKHSREGTPKCLPCLTAHNTAVNARKAAKRNDPNELPWRGTWRRDGLVWRPVPPSQEQQQEPEHMRRTA